MQLLLSMLFAMLLMVVAGWNQHNWPFCAAPDWWVLENL